MEMDPGTSTLNQDKKTGFCAEPAHWAAPFSVEGTPGKQERHPEKAKNLSNAAHYNLLVV